MTLNIQFDPELGLLEVLPGSPNIPAGSFKQRDDIQTVTFSDDLENIDSNAFASCRNLTTLNLPDSLSSIGKQSFSNGWVLSDLQLGDSLTTIGEKASYRSPQLREVSIPDSVIRIGHDAFAGTGITTMVLPSHFSDNPPTEAFEPGTVFSYRNEESIDSGELTNSGWQSQSNSGLWTKEADRLDSSEAGQTISWTIADQQKVDTLQGGDSLIVEGANRPALTNAGSLKMNRGKDRLHFSVNGHATALVNEGMINMGKGRDQIDLVTGLLAGEGKIKLGPGNDLFSSFGQQGMLNGGKGTDQLRLPTGRYELRPEGKRWRITRDERTMVISNIETIGSQQTPEGSLLRIKDLELPSTLIIDESGISLI